MRGVWKTRIVWKTLSVWRMRSVLKMSKKSIKCLLFNDLVTEIF